MRIAMTLLVLMLAISTTACKGKKKDPGPTPTPGSQTMQGSDTMAGSQAGSAKPPEGSGSDSGSSAAGSGSGGEEVTMKNQAGNCPSTVLGATTKADVKGKDVILTITADDKDAVAAIQKRTAELIKEKSDGATTGSAHDQKGTHGGGTGMCPVYWTDGGKAVMKKDAKGAVVTITPKEKPEDLKAIIDGRITKAAAWVKDNIKAGDAGNKGGVGGGKGEHGSTHSGSGDGKGKDRKEGGTGGGVGSGGGGGKGTGGGNKDKKDAPPAGKQD